MRCEASAPLHAEGNVAARPKFARLSRDRPLAVKQMAARIEFLIEFFSEDGRSMRMQEVKRGLHAYLFLEFDDAIKLLEQRRPFVIHRVPGRGHVFRVVLKQNARARLPDSTSGLTLPQSDAKNFAVNVLLTTMFTGLPWVVPVTVVWLVPLKCSASVNWKSMCPFEPILPPLQTNSVIPRPREQY